MFRRAILILLLLASQSLAANKYVRSTDGNDADDGSTWALAKATLAGAFTAASAGDTIYVSDNHAETQASAMTLTSPGTAASPCRVLCGDDAAEPPTALATTATITTTSTSAISFAGFDYYYGITFTAGTGAATSDINTPNTSAMFHIFDNCTLKLAGGASSRILIGSNSGNVKDSGVVLRNTTINFGTSTHSLGVQGCPFLWVGGSYAGTAPTSLIIPPPFGSNSFAEIRGVDLSVVSGALVTVSNANAFRVNFDSCKLHASATATTGTHVGTGGPYVTIVNCDSGDTNYRYQKTNYQGTITQESTIVRTGGATDGTTPISRRMVSSANSKYFSPLESDPIYFWNETTGSTVTVTVPVITDNVTLTNAEAWVEVDYLGTSGYPISSMTSDRSTDILASASNQTTDSTSTWTTTGLTTPVKQELSVTITPQEKGLIRARVMLAKASTTMYYDPKILTGSARQYMAGGALGVGNEGVSSGGGVSRARVVNSRD